MSIRHSNNTEVMKETKKNHQEKEDKELKLKTKDKFQINLFKKTYFTWENIKQ